MPHPLPRGSLVWPAQIQNDPGSRTANDWHHPSLQFIPMAQLHGFLLRAWYWAIRIGLPQEQTGEVCGARSPALACPGIVFAQAGSPVSPGSLASGGRAGHGVFGASSGACSGTPRLRGPSMRLHLYLRSAAADSVNWITTPWPGVSPGPSCPYALKDPSPLGTAPINVLGGRLGSTAKSGVQLGGVDWHR